MIPFSVIWLIQPESYILSFNSSFTDANSQSQSYSQNTIMCSVGHLCKWYVFLHICVVSLTSVTVTVTFLNWKTQSIEITLYIIKSFTDAKTLAKTQTCTLNRLIPSNGQPCKYDSFLHYLAYPAWITFGVKISYSTEESTHFLSSHLLQMQTGRVSQTVKTPSCALLDTHVSETPFYISAWFLSPQSP